MPHKLKVTFESGTKKVELDGKEVNTLKGVSLKMVGATVECNLTHNSFGVDLTSREGEIEFVIPDSLAEALL